jgi:hypothetical protein
MPDYNMHDERVDERLTALEQDLERLTSIVRVLESLHTAPPAGEKEQASSRSGGET